uniref:Acylphosphatase-like domain-containing protein n=1 Tax=Fibrocapsa japonica TaxID=94617 RepID=A0A7S2XVC5_9STRA|mmetsp:Transcript_15486/g.22789  ORF Transcript_15486/g.22789 Transcript_15486/m.22789 type:complete len:160 (+) Transcript_15486:96-575(+)
MSSFFNACIAIAVAFSLVGSSVGFHSWSIHTSGKFSCINSYTTSTSWNSALYSSVNDADVKADIMQAKILLKGQVQGGYFRAQCKNEAFRFRGLLGALRELPDGSTKVVVEGPEQKILSFLKWCKRGPGLTQIVDDVQVEWLDSTGIFDTFEVFTNDKE